MSQERQDSGNQDAGTCPKCGADRASSYVSNVWGLSIEFKCDSRTYEKGVEPFQQSDKCRIAELEAHISRLTAALQGERERFRDTVNEVLREYAESPEEIENLARSHCRGARAACRQILERI